MSKRPWPSEAEARYWRHIACRAFCRLAGPTGKTCADSECDLETGARSAPVRPPTDKKERP